MSVEERATGNVAAWVVMAYVTANGPGVVFWIMVLSLLGKVADCAGTFWISIWATASLNAYVAAYVAALEHQPAPAAFDNAYYLHVYIGLGMASVGLTTLRGVFLAKGRIAASRTLHAQLLGRVLSASVFFFDSTPIGRACALACSLRRTRRERGPRSPLTTAPYPSAPSLTRSSVLRRHREPLLPRGLHARQRAPHDDRSAAGRRLHGHRHAHDHRRLHQRHPRRPARASDVWLPAAAALLPAHVDRATAPREHRSQPPLLALHARSAGLLDDPRLRRRERLHGRLGRVARRQHDALPARAARQQLARSLAQRRFGLCLLHRGRCRRGRQRPHLGRLVRHRAVGLPRAGGRPDADRAPHGAV